MKRKIETNRGVGSCRCRKQLEEVDRSGQKWTEMEIMDLSFQREYLLLALAFLLLVLLLLLFAAVLPVLFLGVEAGSPLSRVRKHVA